MLNASRLGCFGRFNVMTDAELDDAHKELEFLKTDIVLGRPIDTERLIELAEKAVKTARRIDKESESIHNERELFATEALKIADRAEVDLRRESKSCKDKKQAQRLLELAESIVRDMPETTWSSEYDADRHES